MLTLAELGQYCDKDDPLYKWRNLMIFENLKNIEKIGIFGNANPEYLQDWIDIEIDSDRYYSEGPSFNTETNRGCDLGTSVTLDIYYGKINTVNNPQYEILRVVKKENINEWIFKGTNPLDKEAFKSYVTINFKEENQESFLWVPPVARLYIPRNTLYPFKTYLGAQAMVQNMWICVGCILSLYLLGGDSDKKYF
jgi:hypothetical protein